jgi:hypothetical protein
MQIIAEFAGLRMKAQVGICTNSGESPRSIARPVRFADRSGVSGDLLRIQSEAFQTALVGQPRRFHGRCDGHANTLTVILDRNGNIFGGFTPIEWESRVWNWKRGFENSCIQGDDSHKSFLFTLKNPHNIASRIFGLKTAEKDQAIVCDFNFGPTFGRGIGVSDHCNVNAGNWTNLDSIYANDTGLDGKTVFTGGLHFQVNEIEVFEITE